MLKRFAAILLVIVMVIGVFPVSTVAEEIDLVRRAFINDERIKSYFNQGRNGNEIIYTYNGEETTKDAIISKLLPTEEDMPFFTPEISSPDPDIYTDVESVLAWGMDDLLESGDATVTYESGKATVKITNAHFMMRGKLCNVEKKYDIVWKNANGSQTTSETVRFVVNFPIHENYPWMDYYNSAISPDRISVFSTKSEQKITSGTSYSGLSVSSIEAGKVNASYNKAENTNEESFNVRIAAPEEATQYKLLVVSDSVDFEIDKTGDYDYQSDIVDMELLEENYISVPVNLGSDEGGDYTTIDGIKVYESAGNSNRKQTVIVKWLDGNDKPIPGNWSEYLYIDLTTQEEKVTTPAGQISEEVTSPASENVSITWTKKKQSIVPANSETKGKFYFELSTDGTLPSGAKIYIPYSFISSGMNEAEAKKLNINITNHSYGAEANTSGIVCEEFGMTFQTDELGAFVLSWNAEGETEEDGRSEYLPEEFYDYWDINEFVTEGQIELEAHEALIDDLTYKFVDGVLVVTVKNIPKDDWKAAYYDLRAGALQIFADIKIEAPASSIVGVAVNNGNGPTYQNLKNRLNNNYEIEYDNFDPKEDYIWGGNAIGQVSVDGDKITVMPMGSGGVYFTVMLWKDNSGKVIPQILPYVFEVADDADKVTFENEKKNVSEGNIIIDDRATGESPVLSAKYDETSGILEYTYNGNKSKTDEAIAGEIAGTSNRRTIETVIEAPENYYDENEQTQVTLGVSIDNRNYPLVGKSVPFDVIWYNDNGDVLKQVITIVFDPGKNWLDIIAEPITDSERIIYYSINDPDIEYRDETLASLSLAGMTVDIEPGYIHSSFDFEKLTEIDIETVANAEAHILPPDAPVRGEGESLEDWIARAYKTSEYAAIKVGSTGISDYDPQMADDMNDFIVNMDPDALDSGSAAVNIAEFKYIPVNGLNVWFTVNTGDKGHAIIIYWYKEGSNEPDLCEYIYAKCDPLIVEETTDAVSESDLDEAVKAPTPIGSGWSLTTNHFAQEKQYDDVNAYYFQLEGDENTPDDEKVIYLPYSFIDENLTYEQAVEMGLQVKIYHYKDDHIALVEGAPLDGELREEGIRFVVNSFSPFVLEWSSEEPEDVPENVSDNKTSTETVTITISGDKAQENEENPNTGAEPMLAAAAAIAAMSCAAIFVN